MNNFMNFAQTMMKARSSLGRNFVSAFSFVLCVCALG